MRTDIADIIFVFIFLFEYGSDTETMLVFPDKIVMDIDIIKM